MTARAGSGLSLPDEGFLAVSRCRPHIRVNVTKVQSSFFLVEPKHSIVISDKWKF